MMSDLTDILERHKGSLKKMKVAFEHMARVMKSKIYKALVHSEQYKKIKSVHDFFGALAKYWRPVDCSLLCALVKATQCQPAMERLKAFLCSRSEGKEVALLLRQDQEPPNEIERSSLVGYEAVHQSDITSEVSTAKNTNDPPSIVSSRVPEEPTLPNQHPNGAANQVEGSSLVGHESAHQSNSSSEVSAAKNLPSIPLSEVPEELTHPNQHPNGAANQMEGSSLVGHESAHQSDNSSEVSAAKNTTGPPSIAPLKVPEETMLPNQHLNDTVCSQPQAQSDSLPVTAVVDQDGLTLEEYDRKANILCGVLRVPRFMLQLMGIDPGSVIIKWSTAEGLLPYMLSNVILDTDLQLLLQEKIVSIQVGSEYYVTVGSQDFWIRVSKSA